MSKKGPSKTQSESGSTTSSQPNVATLKNVNTALTLLWKYLTQEDVSKLELMNPFDVEKYLAESFGLISYEIDLRQACFLDYYVTQYWWAARQKKFTNEQVSTYFSISYILMENLRGKIGEITVFNIVLFYESLINEERTCTFSQNINQLQTMLSDLNESVKTFTDDIMRDILNNLLATFFQNYRLFEYVASETQNEIILPKEMLVECPREDEFPYPPPLDEAMPEKIYKKFVLKIEDEIKEEEAEKFENIELKQEVIDQIHSRFEGISIEDAKQIIFEVTNEIIADLKIDMKNKIKAREAALINEFTKSQKKK